MRANLDYFALEKAKCGTLSPFGALDQLVGTYFEFARRFPARYRFLLKVSPEDSPLWVELKRPQLVSGTTASVTSFRTGTERERALRVESGR